MLVPSLFLLSIWNVSVRHPVVYQWVVAFPYNLCHMTAMVIFGHLDSWLKYGFEDVLVYSGFVSYYGVVIIPKGFVVKATNISLVPLCQSRYVCF